MAKFCKYCGTPLAEGQVCTCPQAQADAAGAQPQFTQQQTYTQPPQQQTYTQQQTYNQQYTQPPQKPKGPSPVGSAFHNLVPYLKSYMHSPVEATRSAMSQRDIFLPIVLLVIQMLAVGLVIFGMLNKICGMSGGPVSASILWSLIAGILTSAIAMIVYILLMFAVAKIMGSSCSFQDVLIASGANSLFVTAAFLLSFVVFLLSLKLGFYLLIFVLIVWLGMGVVTVQAVTPDSNSGKFWLCYLVGMMLSFVITCFVLPRTSWMAVEHISVSYGVGRDRETYTIGEMLEEEGVRSFDDLLEEMMDDIF